MANFNMAQQVKSNTRQTASHVSHAAANPWLERLERFGYLIRGLVYATIGVLALQLAMGAGGATTSQSGAIAMLGSQPFGKVLLILIVVGLAGYSLWGFIRAIFDPLHRGSDSKGILARIGFAFSGLTYGILIIPPLQSLMNQGSKPASNPADISVVLFNLPFGKWLVVGLGLVWIAIGVGQMYVAYKQDFKKDFQFNKMSASEIKWATRLGQIGYAARGIVFAVIGTIIFQAGLTHNPSQPQGFDTALLKLAQAPNGTLILGGVALGLIAFGIFSALSARWIKVSVS
jgi:Domain of Unknown Function (DUF1206)